MTTLLLAIIYISFISLGLPDGLLGAGWPSMYPELNVPVSYVGTCLAPPLFGLIANHISASLFPLFILCFLALMALMHERLIISSGI